MGDFVFGLMYSIVVIYLLLCLVEYYWCYLVVNL